MVPLLEQRLHRLAARVAARDEPLVVGLDREHRHQPNQRAVVGEDPDDVRAPADLAVEALERVGASELAPVLSREGVEGEDLVLGLLEDRRRFRRRPLELGDGLREPRPRLLAVRLVEDRPDQRRQEPMLVAPGVAQAVAQEVAARDTRACAGSRS
jgi:hypothetical protein